MHRLVLERGVEPLRAVHRRTLAVELRVLQRSDDRIVHASAEIEHFIA